jgi:Holliday junction resolvasome RuvABC endonuclease subunit
MNTHEKRVLALDPTHPGCGFAVLEGPDRLIDWGVTGTTCRSDRVLLARIDQVIEDYSPDVVVVEDYTADL